MQNETACGFALLLKTENRQLKTAISRMLVQEKIIDESMETADAVPVRYRSLNVTAVLSVVFGVISILTVFGWVFWVIPMISIGLAVRALKRIQYASEEYTGEVFARAGIGLAIVFWLSGMYILHYIQTHSIPSGYKPITFDYLQPNPDKSSEIIPDRAFDLEPNDKDPDKRIFIAGYIYPGRRTINIKEFIFVPTVAHCNFCTQQLKSTEMMNVKLTGDLTVDYTSRLMRIGGKMRIDRDQMLNPFGGLPYQLEADYLQE
jgi:hypothetical protein